MTTRIGDRIHSRDEAAPPVRRRIGDAIYDRAPQEQRAPGIVQGTDPYANDWLAQTQRSVEARTKANYTSGLRMLGNSLIGDTEGRVAAANDYLDAQERASRLGPAAQDFDTNKGVGHNASALGYMAANMVPDMAFSIAGGLVGRTGARGVAAKLGTRNMMAEAVRATGRTPRGVDIAGKTGFALGVTAGGFPGLNANSAEKMADPNLSWEDAQKLNLTTAAAAATQAIPLERLGGRILGNKAADAGRGFISRTGREMGRQGLLEGAQEVTQEAIQNAGHAWVEGNLQPLIGDGSFNDILSMYGPSFIAGNILGSAMGGAAEVGSTTVDATGRAVRNIPKAYESTRSMVEDGLASFSAWRKHRGGASAGRRYAPGERMDDSAEGGMSMDDIASMMRGNETTAPGSAAERMAQHEADAAERRENDDLISAMTGDGDMLNVPGEVKPWTQNLYQYENDTQARLMAYVNEQRLTQPQAQAAAKALHRLYTAQELTDTDMAVYDFLRDSGAMSPQALRGHQALGQVMSGRAQQAGRENAAQRRLAGVIAQMDATPEASAALLAERGDLLRAAGYNTGMLNTRLSPAKMLEQYEGVGQRETSKQMHALMSSDGAAAAAMADGTDRSVGNALDNTGAEARSDRTYEDTGVDDAGNTYGEGISVGTTGERFTAAQAAARDAQARVDNASTDGARRAAQRELDMANEQLAESRAALNEHVWGKTSAKYPYGKNIYSVQHGEGAGAQKVLADANADAGRVRVDIPLDDMPNTIAINKWEGLQRRATKSLNTKEDTST